MINIFLAAQIYPPETGGAAIYFSQLADILEDSEQFNPVVIAGYLKNEPLIRYDNDVPIVRVATNDINIINNIGFPLDFIDRELNLQPDLIHLHPHLTGVETLFRNELSDNIPIIYDYRGKSVKIHDVPYGDHKFYFSVMKEVDEMLMKRFRLSKNEIYRSPVAVDVSNIGEQISNEKKDFRIIFVGNFRQNKRLDIAYSAVMEVNKEYDIEFVIVGDGPDENVEQLAKRADKQNEFIQYLGGLAHSNALREIKEADVLIIPSDLEGDPRVVMEALSLNTPVIGADVGTIKRRVEDAGIITENNTKNFKNAIINIIEHKTDYKRNTEKRKEHITTVEEMEKIITNTYLTILNKVNHD